MDLSEIITKSPNGIDVDVSSVSPTVPTSSGTMMGTVKAALDKTVEKSEEVSSGLPWESIIRYGLIIIILAFLGFNLFTFLVKTIHKRHIATNIIFFWIWCR